MLFTIKRTFNIAVSLLICLFPNTNTYGQSFEEYRQMTNRQFENRRQTVRKDYEALKEKVNKEFSDILGREWKPSGERSIRSNPLEAIPSLPPQDAPDEVAKPVQKQCDAVQIAKNSANPVPPTEIAENPEGTQTRIQSMFYGSNISVRFDIKDRASIKRTDPSDIVELWNRFSTTEYSNLLADFYSIRQRFELCDWASLKLSQKVSEMVYGNMDSNESVVLQSFLLTQCGLMSCMIHDGNDRLHLLVAADKTLVGYPGYNIDGYDMFQVDREEISSGTVPQKSFSSTVPLRMSISCSGKFDENRYKTDKGATVNRNDIDFYADYPSFFDEGRPVTAFWHVGQVQLSSDARETLYPYLKGIIDDMSEVEAVQTLLLYFYKVFPYKEDEKVWGKERYFFPEETLYYEFCDCEDRAILFTRLVRDLLGLKTALIYMPGHLAAAVRFSGNVEGDAVTSGGNRYVICDPTYINANVGQAMPGWNEKQIEVVVL